MPRPLEQLLESYFAGTMSTEEKAELQSRLRADPAARRQFWAEAGWESILAAWGRQETGRTEGLQDPAWNALPSAAPTPIHPVPGRPARRFPPVRKWLPSLGLAAGLALAALLFTSRAPVSAGASLARLTFDQRAEWVARPAALAPGTMPAGAYQLRRGLVRFETARGAVVTISGPARFTLTAADRLELETGRLTARMQGQGGRLTVAVDGMDVTDLGTAFGIDATGHDRTLVSVFAGSVSVAAGGHPAPGMTVEAGTSIVEHRGPGLDVRTTPYESERFGDLWPLAVGIDEASRLVAFVTPGPLLRPLRDYRANDRLFLFAEQQHITTDRSLLVDLSPDAPAWPESPVSPYPLPPGRRVSSYLVFFHPAAAAPGGLRQLRGEIVFQHRVLGIICSDSGLDLSDAPLGIATADYRTPGQRRGLEEADKMSYRSAALPHDSVRIGADGRTVQFDLHVSDEREQLRVIVAVD